MSVKLGSLFDGIGGFPLAGFDFGIEPVWASEIEPFPIKVTQIRFPNMQHVGDITKLNGADLPPVDIITGGSPCQDLSVAGKRAGLQGERSGLFMEQVRIIKEARAKFGKPRFMVWENVPGAFSSAGGKDFQAVLEETARIAETGVSIPRPADGKWAGAGCIMGDTWSIAWRVLDAQFWGVPQRRRRIFLVADFGGQSAPEILFKHESVSGNTAESGTQGEGAAARAEGGAGTTSWGLVSKGNGDAFLMKEQHMSLSCGGGQAGQGYPAICFQQNQRDIEKTPSITSRCAAQGEGTAEGIEGCAGTAICPTLTSYNLDSRSPQSEEQQHIVGAILRAERGAGAAICLNDQGGQIMDVSFDVTGTLRHQMGGHLPLTLQMREGKAGGGKGPLIQTDQSATLGTGNTQVAFTPSSFGNYEQGCGTLRAGGGDLGGGSEALITQPLAVRRLTPHPVITGTLNPGAHPGSYNGQDAYNDLLIPSLLSVRRLTPLECERLQGFPDGWTDIPKATDSARYKALGNSVAIPCVKFVLQGIAEEISKGGN